MSYFNTTDNDDLAADFALEDMPGYRLDEPDTIEESYDEEAEEAALKASMCPVRYQILVDAQGTLGELSQALKSHQVECACCGSDRKIAVSDRLYVNPGAVCCGEVA